MNSSPYRGRPPHTHWVRGVLNQTPDTITGLYRKKFTIPRVAQIATAGSCFAQHIARHLRQAGYQVIDEEPAPSKWRPEEASRFGFGLYSARYANVYVVRQLMQLIQEAHGEFEPADPVWEKDGRFFDAQRPSVEPEGLDSPEEVLAHRKEHLAAVRRVVDSADVFIFTFGLTEAWIHSNTGTVYPTAPGTIAGSYDPTVHSFKNYSFNEIFADFCKFRQFIKSRKPRAKFIVTVSPVPLMATATDDHVLTATTYSKSVLRAVAGQLQNKFADVDYFPSYELISTPFSRGAFYKKNLRDVTNAGVATAMHHFIQQHSLKKVAAAQSPVAAEQITMEKEDDVVCEEELLAAFATK